MKNYLYLILFCTGIIFGQSTDTLTNNFSYTYKNASFWRTIFGTSLKEKYIEFNNEKEWLYWVIVTIKIENLNNEESFEFDCNNFSLVDSINLLRHRPRLITGINLGAPGLIYLRKNTTKNIGQVNLKDFIVYEEDTFLKYTQKGIKDYDHYELDKSILNFKAKSANQYRFIPITFYKNKKRDMELVMIFPTRLKKSGKFSLYFKDKLIENFML